MAGSRKWQVYQDDSGVQWSVNIDESNGEIAGFQDITSVMALAGTTPPVKPKELAMRYVNVKDEVSGSSRKVYVGSKTHGLVTGNILSLLLWAFTDGSVISAISWAVTSFIGETNKIKRPSSADTGFLDADAS